MKPKYKVGQLAQLPGVAGSQPTFGIITGLMNRGTSVVYEIAGQESLTAEEFIETVWVSQPAPRVRKSVSGDVSVTVNGAEIKDDEAEDDSEMESVESKFHDYGTETETEVEEGFAGVNEEA